DRQGNLDDLDGGLASAREAVAIARELAAASPDRYRRLLADVLDTLRIRLSLLQDQRGALAAMDEAVTLYRQVQDDDRREALAWALRSLGNARAWADDLPGALAAGRESVAL